MSPKLRDPEEKCGRNQKFGTLQQRKEAKSFRVHEMNQAAREHHQHWCVSFCFVRNIESQKSSVTSYNHDRTGTAGFLEVEENLYFIRFDSIFFFSLLFFCLRRRTSSLSSRGSAQRQRSCFHSLSVSGVSTHKRRMQRRC